MYGDAMLVVVGFITGILLAVVVAWWMLVRKDRACKQAMAEMDAEQKRLVSSLNAAQVHSSALGERVQIIQEIKNELAQKSLALEKAKGENAELLASLASISTEKQKAVEYFNERINDLMAVHDSMKKSFSLISQEALHKNAEMINASFKQSMEHFFKATEQERTLSNENLQAIMSPLKETLATMDGKVQELETKRQGAYSGLKEQIDSLLLTQGTLQKETHKLAQALNAPTIRGRWGEMQLRRVVELSGLSAHCDFLEQQSVSDGDEAYRPDMIVTLPKNKKIVIDAKAPLEIFSQGLEDESVDKAKTRGQELAQSLRRHLLALKKKSYQNVVSESPEFVVMFLPGEAFLHWALLADPTLLDFAAQHDVIIVTPVTLVALLKAVAFGFKQEAIANNIEEVRRLAQQLIDRINKVSSHFEKLGKSLKQATDAYNQALSSLDSRVLDAERKLSEIKSVSAGPVLSAALPYVDNEPREVVFKNLAVESSVSDEQ